MVQTTNRSKPPEQTELMKEQWQDELLADARGAEGAQGAEGRDLHGNLYS